MTEQRIYATNNNNLEPISITKFEQTVVQVSAGYNWTVFVLEDGTAYETTRLDRNRNRKKLNVKPILMSRCGYTHYALLSQEGDVYGRGAISENYGQIGMGKSKNCQVPEIIPFFKEKKGELDVVSIICSCYCTFYLCENQQLWGSGYNHSGQVGIKEIGTNQYYPVKISDNVTNVYTDNYSYFVFWKTEDDKVMGSGPFGNERKLELTNCIELKQYEITDISVGHNQSLVLTQKKSDGLQALFHLTGKNLRKLNLTFESPIVEMSSGNNHHCIRLEDNTTYGVNSGGVFNRSKFNLPTCKSGMKWTLICDSNNTIFFEDVPSNERNTIQKDLGILYENSLGTDLEIVSGYRIHKDFVKARIGRPIDKIKEVISGWEKEDLDLLFLWMYTGTYKGKKQADLLGSLLGISELFKTKVMDTMKQLWIDEDGKNFTILVKEEDMEEEEEEEEEEELVEVPVHKFILYARSGLYRDMFENISVEQDSVTDQSGKTPETIELFVKYLYLDQLELTADDDPALVVEELTNAAEFFQLSDENKFNREIKKIKKQFKL
ncbi:regulator of chromosome condensation [Anaeramoeba flamelloides]|uniref:Regulator of chromosome condensation n=1 Tax=Anaeramoeba flamelloides TaxID=1746091 RepID=A0AAV7Y3K1_9EUKA|nr:regulator of chromosome condensation [Anaeramoeba flamelloides]